MSTQEQHTPPDHPTAAFYRFIASRSRQSPNCLNNIHVACNNSQCECGCHQIPPIQPDTTTAALAAEAMNGDNR